jgi:transposase-like protein
MTETDFDMTPTCPRCGVSTVTPSKAQTVLEKLGRLACVGNYRCHSCLKRFVWFMSPLARVKHREVALPRL